MGHWEIKFSLTAAWQASSLNAGLLPPEGKACFSGMDHDIPHMARSSLVTYTDTFSISHKSSMWASQWWPCLQLSLAISLDFIHKPTKSFLSVVYGVRRKYD